MKSRELLYALSDVRADFVAEAAPRTVGRSAAVRRRKRWLLAAAVAALLLLAACAAVVFRLFDIPFPFSERGRTPYNAAVYDVDPFRVELELPEGWSLRERENAAAFDGHVALSGMWSVVDILDGKGETAGAVGYNTYEEYEGAENLPAAIYGQIALGNDYRFDVRDSYRVVKTMPYGETALTDVFYSAVIAGGAEEKINRGIVSYDRELGVYVALEFAAGSIGGGELETVAESIRFVSK